jgi:hypothetical protein
MTEEMKVFAQKACEYARTQIIEGSTQLANNYYDDDKKMALRKALSDVREVAGYDECTLQIDSVLKRFEQSIAVCKKFSIGNCHELASMALYYMVLNHPEINSEVYEISGGDHVFLVIGRIEDSDPKSPETWGDNAYICDPWLNSVYPAIEFKEKTINFYQLQGRYGEYENCTEPFNPSVHQLTPYPNLNSTHILKHSAQSNKILLDVFLDLNQKFISILQQFAQDLDEIGQKMGTNYQKNRGKSEVLKEKINYITRLTADMNHTISDHIKNNETNKYLSYKELNDDLQRMMKSQMHALREIGQIPKQFAMPGPLTRMIMKLLNSKSDSSQDYHSAVDKIINQKTEYSQMITNSYSGKNTP